MKATITVRPPITESPRVEQVRGLISCSTAARAWMGQSASER
jgi:hypothetical protein